MDIKALLTKAKKDVSSALSKAAGAAEYVARLSKLKLSITSIESDINGLLQKVGEYVYNKKDEFAKDEYLTDLFDEISEKEAEVEGKTEQIAEIKKGFEERRKREKEAEKKPEEETEEKEPAD